LLVAHSTLINSFFSTPTEENHDMIISEGGLDLMKNLAQQTSDLKIKRAICNAFANLATDG